MPYRKYPLNENYFDNIDHQNKAYFLGLLYADGCNVTYQTTIQIQLSGQDKEILEKLKKLIFKCERPLYVKEARKLTINGKETTGQKAYVLCINSKHISQTLEKYGMTKAKSQTVEFPKWLDTNLQSHFMRGYFDGDGSIFLTKNNQTHIQIIGSKIFLEQLHELLIGIKIKNSICKTGHSEKVNSLSIHGNRAGRKFLKWLYKDAELYLQRKFIKKQEILNKLPQSKVCLACGTKHNCKTDYCKKHYYEFIGKALRHKRWVEKGC